MPSLRFVPGICSVSGQTDYCLPQSGGPKLFFTKRPLKIDVFLAVFGDKNAFRYRFSLEGSGTFSVLVNRKVPEITTFAHPSSHCLNIPLKVLWQFGDERKGLVGKGMGEAENVRVEEETRGWRQFLVPITVLTITDNGVPDGA